MLSAAGKYYENMSLTISHSHRTKWEADIANAEARRLHDPAAMDILAAEVSRNHNALPESRASSGTDLYNSIRMALRIEERQCAPFIYGKITSD